MTKCRFLAETTVDGHLATDLIIYDSQWQGVRR